MGEALTWQEWMTWAGAMLAALTLLYLLRPRRRRIEVPFGGLWQQVLAQAEARQLGRRWRRLLSWLLMVTLAALMLGALGEGHLGLRGCSEPAEIVARHTVVIVDTSASMQTRDGLPVPGSLDRQSRLDEAKARVRELIQGARPGERLLLLTASGRLRTRTGWTDDRRKLNEAVSAVRASDGGLDLQRALDAATDALVGRSHPRTVVVTDGGPPLQPLRGGSAASAGIAVTYLVVGPLRLKETRGVPPVDNLAVERVSVRANPGDPGRGLLMVRVRNDRDTPVVARVDIAAASDARSVADFQRDASVRAVKTLRVPAGGGAWLRVSDVDLSVGRFAARVRPPVDATWRDRASWDDWGFTVLAERRQLDVLLVTPGNLFLEAALLANERYRLRKLSPEAYDPAALARDAEKGAATRPVHVVVLDQTDKPAPAGVASLRMAVKPPEGSAPETLRDAGDLVVRDHGHPVMRGVTFHDVNLDKVRLLPTQAGDKVLAGERGGGAVLVAREDEVRRLEMGLDLMETDMGARYALPVFMGNAVDWLAGEDAGLLSALVLGEPWAVQAPVRSTTWRWLAPGAEAVPARVAGDQLVGASEVQGVHVWETAEGQQVARPTRLPDTERPALLSPPAARWSPPPVTAQVTRERPPLPVWSWLLLVALGLLTVEWALYHRRRTV